MIRKGVRKPKQHGAKHSSRHTASGAGYTQNKLDGTGDSQRKEQKIKYGNGCQRHYIATYDAPKFLQIKSLCIRLYANIIAQSRAKVNCFCQKQSK